MKAWEWIKANITKISGWLTTAVATIQVSSAKSVLFTDAQFEVFVLVMGLFISFLGMFNTQQATAEAAARKIDDAVTRQQGGHVRPGLLAALAVALVVACSAPILTGCTAIQEVTGVECRDFNDCADVAYDSAEEWVANVQAMNAAGQLSNEDALNALDALETYVNGISLARTMAQVNEADGRARLEATRVGLRALIAYLETKKGE